MKIIRVLFLFAIFLTFLYINVEASIQKPALWPAINDITPTDEGYAFEVNVMVYSPDGITGNLLVAGYDSNNRLVDIVNYGNIEILPYVVPQNCSNKNFLGNSFGLSLNLLDKNYAVIKAFVIDFDTLKPEIESGKIEYFFNNGDSYVNVDYTLESDHYNHVSGDYYYYYYYDGEFKSVEFLLNEEFNVGTENSFSFQYYNTFESSTGIYQNKDLANKTISYEGFSGVKIKIWIGTDREIFLKRYGFKTSSIRVHCDFNKLK